MRHERSTLVKHCVSGQSGVLTVATPPNPNLVTALLARAQWSNAERRWTMERSVHCDPSSDQQLKAMVLLVWWDAMELVSNSNQPKQTEVSAWPQSHPLDLRRNVRR